MLIHAVPTDYAPSTSEAQKLPALRGFARPSAGADCANNSQYSVACLVEAVSARGHVPFAAFQNGADAMLWLTGRTVSKGHRPVADLIPAIGTAKITSMPESAC